MKRQAGKWFANHISDNGLITTVYKASRWVINKNKYLDLFLKMDILVETDLITH